MPILCVVSSDIDCIIIPDSCCKKCVEQKLITYNITDEFLRDSKNIIKGFFTKCICKK